MSIPKVIHYCWFGRGEKSKLIKKCMKSWKKYCPDYEIIEWNEDNFDVNCNQYIKEAYEAKKWAFVSDYARFEILYKYGGVYLDTDVEIIKPLDDILSKGPLMGCEKGSSDWEGIRVAPGLIVAAEPGMQLLKELIEDYSKDRFINDDGSYNLWTVVFRVTELLFQRGLKNTDEIQYVEGFYIYPKEYFCPKVFSSGKTKKTKNTVCIHHFAASWFSEEKAKKCKKLRKKIKRDQIKYYIMHIPNRIMIFLLGKNRYGKFKNYMRKKC